MPRGGRLVLRSFAPLSSFLSPHGRDSLMARIWRCAPRAPASLHPSQRFCRKPVRFMPATSRRRRPRSLHGSRSEYPYGCARGIVDDPGLPRSRLRGLCRVPASGVSQGAPGRGWARPHSVGFNANGETLPETVPVLARARALCRNVQWQGPRGFKALWPPRRIAAPGRLGEPRAPGTVVALSRQCAGARSRLRAMEDTR